MSEAIKAIKCELCGSNELVKQDDYFVCQFCGTKYTPEAAKKLIVDIQSPISINGAVEVTTGNAEKSKCLKKLNTLFELKQWYELHDKLKIAIREYPDEWRVWFLRFKYIVLCQRYPMQKLDGSKVPYISYFSLFEEEFDKAKQVCPETEIISFEQCYSVFFNDLISEIENQNIVIRYHDAKCFSTISYPFENNRWIDYTKKYMQRCENAALAIKNELVDYQKRRIQLKTYDGTYTFTGEDIQNAQYFDGHSLGKIEFRTGYEIATYGDYLTVDEFIRQIKEQNPIGGCYIATCVYGSYDCPEVRRLRRFRDNQLSKTWYGRAFISAYYATSPALVKWFGETAWFKKTWKAVIDRILMRLKDKGFDDTSYIDK